MPTLLPPTDPRGEARRQAGPLNPPCLRSPPGNFSAYPDLRLHKSPTTNPQSPAAISPVPEKPAVQSPVSESGIRHEFATGRLRVSETTDSVVAMVQRTESITVLSRIVTAGVRFAGTTLAARRTVRGVTTYRLCLGRAVFISRKGASNSRLSLFKLKLSSMPIISYLQLADNAHSIGKPYATKIKPFIFNN